MSFCEWLVLWLYIGGCCMWISFAPNPGPFLREIVFALGWPVHIAVMMIAALTKILRD